MFAGAMDTLQVYPSLSAETIPLSQVTNGVGVQWEDPIVWRFNRKRTITVQSVPPDGVPDSVLRNNIVKKVESVPLPPGYSLEWGGIYESSRDSQASLIPGVVPAALIIAMILVSLANAFRPPLIILCVIPFAMIGVTAGLLVTGQPFGFLALLGAMSLSGMMIKNAIVLLDEINENLVAGKSPYQSVIDARRCRVFGRCC